MKRLRNIAFIYLYIFFFASTLIVQIIMMIIIRRTMINNYSRVIPIMGKYQSIVHRGLTKLTTRDGRCYDCNLTYRSSALFIWFLLRQPEMHFF